MSMEQSIRAALLGISCIVCTLSRPADACMAEFRSIDWLVARSPLIVIGEVVSVRALPVTDDMPERARPERDEAGPAMAKVRILRVLKGQCTRAEIEVRSGPIASCAPYGVYCEFRPGQRDIFILLDAVANGQTAITRGGSIRSLTDISLVESRIHRAADFQAKYLAELKQRSPQTLAAAQELAAEMAKASKAWPESAYGNEGKHAAYQKAVTQLVARLNKVDIEVIVAAQGIDWQSPGDAWLHHSLWEVVLSHLRQDHQADIVRYGKSHLREQLRQAGVEDRLAESYLSSFKDQDLDRTPCFPTDPPSRYGKLNDEQATTEFILSYHAYDRGWMRAQYIMNRTALGQLDGSRLRTIIPAMFGDNDKSMSRIAREAIIHMRGAPFVDLVLDQLDDDPQSWKLLCHPKDPAQTAQRLTALLDHMKAVTPLKWQPYFWGHIEKGNCFEPVVIDAAINALGRAAIRPPADGPVPADHPEIALDLALRQYLDAAMADRTTTPPIIETPADYRKWFKEHPPKATLTNQ